MTETVLKKWQSLVIWGLFCVVTGSIFWFYATSSIVAGDGEIIMPLDDAYIHFQYSRQMALGEPYVYNSGEDATSGATSFIYPYILASGYLLGFHDLDLGYWAMGVGALALLASMWLIYHTLRLFDSPLLLRIMFPVIFAVTGSVSWHFMSGMETGLMIAFSLATIYGFVSGRINFFVISTILLALTRPEGSIMAVIAVALFALRGMIDAISFSIFAHDERPSKPKKYWLLLLPMMAIFVQPSLNFILTGSVSASGNQSKSILSMVPFYWDVVIERILDNFVRVWRELATGRDGYYVPVLIAPLAFIGWVSMVMRSRFRFIALLIVLWLVAISGAIATLDTAFWHFKRYQMPLIVMMFPLAGFGLHVFGDVIQRFVGQVKVARLSQIFAILVILLFSVDTGREFHRLYKVNVNNVVVQPLAMARWLQANTPEDAVIAVHDVGMMRYMGGRTTVDMVGLTTPSAADSWRNGPGAVAEFLMAYDPRPDYVASYTTARGLNYLVDTSIYGELLAEFPAYFDPVDNVALAADYQGIYRFESDEVNENVVLQASASRYVELSLLNLVDQVDVANLESEYAHDYEWRNLTPDSIFISEVYAFDYASCVDTVESCLVEDGGRRINQAESFVINTPTNEDVLIVTRLHPANRGTFDVYVNDRYVETQWIPEIRGQWLEISTLIPSEYITTTQTHIRIVPHMGAGYYMPYYHWVWQGDYLQSTVDMSVIASYQDGALSVSMLEPLLDVIDGRRMLTFYTIFRNNGLEQGPIGDYKYFVHVYADIDSQPITQIDGYVLGGDLLGNWVVGDLDETIMVDLSDIPAGEYQIAFGFYDPANFERLLPTIIEDETDRYWVDEAGNRLFIGTVTIP